MQRTPAPVVPDDRETARSTAVSPTPLAAGDTAATIDGIPISYPDWQIATRLDATMSRLTGQPIPSAEETLDRLVNETLLLRGADLESASVAPLEIQDRIAGLQTAWGLSADQISAALQAADLTDRSLEERVARLILVERAIQTLSAQQPDLEAWLAQARQSAQVSLLQALEPTTTPQPTLQAEPQGETTSQSTNPQSPNPQSPAPDFTLTSLDGQTIQLSDLRGRPVLLNFWATWCPACRTELPALQAAYERYGEQVVFLAVDVKESRDTVASFVSQFGLTFPVLLDEQGQVSDRLYQVRGIPTSLFIAPDGVVSARHIGPLTETDIDRYLIPNIQSPNIQSPNPAPDFTLPAAGGDTLTLSDYTGRSNVVLVFYRGYT
jgi:peroxiredoxin